ncbi:MAG TPA: tetratricopeptide repeat protein [Terracidiphilus sp.]|nr:tetratricopeptide repeat protein [Terracidiphilus sp.]
MKQNFWQAQIAMWIAAWVVSGCVALGVPAARAQAQSSGPGQQQEQNQKDRNQESRQNGSKPAPQQENGNPFPEDEDSAPVMPSGSSAVDTIPGETGAGAAAPSVDRDPVRSPDDAGAAESGDTRGFSSSTSGLDNILNPPDSDIRPKKGGKGDDAAADEMPRETPKEDIDVGNYYMDNKDWKGALSRFQSALVLAPDNPDVYWGLAECERHLGQYAQARENYLKVMEYDPDSHHAKEAKKALRDPEIANAKAPAGGSAH